LLIEAFKRAEVSNTRLVIVGQGNQLDQLRGIAGKDMLLPGFAERPEEWLATFDCFVSAARDEPFGLVLLEAMQVGLPILATASKGASHLAEVIGTPLVPVGDIDALASGIREFVASRPARRIYPMERFGIEAKLAEIEAFYRKELAGLVVRK
jgi:glycosyltransferase involved in cell wall biosynthesis